MKKWAYYNEIDPYCCEWIRNLINAGLITDGEIDNRSIVDVRPDDVRDFVRCHWFSGIAVWDYALGLAGWPDDRPAWTGSCPCQPWSKAGLGKGFDDERHLWPVWFELIRQCRPDTILGEQVPVAVRRGWLDLVHDDLERESYAVGALAFEASHIGEPIPRERVYLAAKSFSPRVARQFEGKNPRPARQGKWRGEADLRAIANAPFVVGDRWPAPLVRRVDHGFAGSVGGMSAYGNALNANAAAAFIGALLDTEDPASRDPLITIAASAVPGSLRGGR